MRIAPPLSFVVAVALVASASCTLFNGLTARPQDAGTDGIVVEDEAGASVDTCAHAYRPDPKADAPTGGDLSIVVVGRSVAFGDGGAETPGFDLDRVCTCEDAAPTSCTPVGKVECDAPGGRDNVLAALAATFSTPDFDFAKATNARIDGGETLIVEITRYNGEDDDGSVDVAVNATLGALGATDDERVAPRFDETDRWALDKASGRQTGTAWVVGRKLVAEMNGPVTLGFDVRLTFNQATITGDIVPRGDGRWTLQNVVVGGRWPRNDALQSLGRQHAPNSTVPLCETQGGIGAVVWATLMSTICASADIARVPAQDRSGGPCEALSGGARVTMAPASLAGSVVRESDAGSKCTQACPEGPDR
jgi:hypothetical protein